MLRILLAVAALYVFAGFTRPAKADEAICSAIGAFIESRPAGFDAFRVLTGDEVARAAMFYNALPGDVLGFAPDSIVLVLMPNGNMRIAFAHNGLVCAAITIPQANVQAVMAIIVGSRA